MVTSFAPAVLLASAAVAPASAFAQPAAQVRNFNLQAGPAADGVMLFARQAGIQVMVSMDATRNQRTAAVQGRMTVSDGLKRLLASSGLRVTSFDGRTATLVAASPTSAIDAGGPTPQVVATPAPEPDPSQDIIVTAQKKRESIQTVPIAVSAFTAKSLDDQKIEGGAELMRAVPNVSFSKTNFASYNFSIRGIGTKALSVTSDPAVAISFNNTPLLRNRLFEQEYFDVERVEVLRGPQGTLYGRNATAGVVNMIPNFAEPDRLASDAKLEVGNYSSMRASGMLNVPLTDTLAVRAAGAWTNRDGYDFNTVTNRHVNGRDLWSTRATASWEPSSRFRVTAAWEHFNEDDDRSRTGKQLCHTDPGPTMIGSKDISAMPQIRGELSQGCAVGSLYDDGAYGLPNGLSVPYILAGATLVQLGNTARPSQGGKMVTLFDPQRDPYAGITQSNNLREIATTYDPTFRAKNDVFQLNIDLALNENLQLYSQTSYTKDFYHSTQDYNRFTSNPIFNNSKGLVNVLGRPLPTDGLSPGGVYTDPQLGASSSILGVDMVKSNSDQWYQEFRLQSSFSGAINFIIGGNYLKFNIDEDYYVFNNLFSAVTQGVFGGRNLGANGVDCTTVDLKDGCPYVDPNTLGSINGDGHNYFRSRNVAETRSLAAFGEIYWKVSDNLKITAGLRYTDDKKTATPVKSQLLLSPGLLGGGNVYIGYPESPDIVQKWQRVTGRFVVDWRPRLAFTDDTLFYASYARGYKGGGANPPGIDANPQYLQFFPQAETFRPESVNAFEIGMKNTFASGRLTLNATAFFYDYTDYQVSQIVDRMALNENYDAKAWGAELEIAWRPTQRFRVNANLGYLGTSIDDGMQSIDVMNRTQGNPDWMVVKPWMQLASNCVAPKALVEKVINSATFNATPSFQYISAFCGSSNYGTYDPGSTFSNRIGITYNPATDAPNQGRGFYANLGGKELPNAPHWTANIGAQYTLPIGAWALTLRGDYYVQDASWARVYNTAIDRLKSWDNANLALTFDRPESGLALQLYVKNVFNGTPITDAFLNSDDSGLTANVFTLDPRIIGFSMRKNF